MAIDVAVQAAMDALRNQPGFGAEPSPPSGVGMSEDAFSPAGPKMLQRNPSCQTAVADAFAFLADAGRSRNTCRARSNDSRARRFDIPDS
jgi:hypothetical protein